MVTIARFGMFAIAAIAAVAVALREFAHAACENFLLAASDELRGSRDPLAHVPPHTVIYKAKLTPAEVVAAIER